MPPVLSRLPIRSVIAARRLGMSLVRVARQLGATGNLSQLMGSLPCALCSIPNGLSVLRQDSGYLAHLLECRHSNGRHHFEGPEESVALRRVDYSSTNLAT
jgi:hypothetical protein